MKSRLRLIVQVLSGLLFLVTPFLGGCVNATRAPTSTSDLDPLTTEDENISYANHANGIERWQLPNGLQVVFLKNQELPLVSGVLYLRGGSLWESTDEIGTSSAMGDQLRQGGAGNLSADALDIKLETLAASIGSSFGQEFGKVSFGCLASDVEDVFNIFSNVVREPRFELGRLNLWKAQRIEEIRRRTDDPNTLASISFMQLLYGPTPYGRVLVEDDVSRINRDALRKIYRRFVQPQRATLAVTGMIEREKLEQLILSHFGDWVGSEEAPEPPPAIEFRPQPGVYFLQQPLSQSTVYFGQQGVARLTPDYLAIDAFNSIFGSGEFGCLLMRRVRTELGLAYAIYGGISPGVVRGKNYVIVQTKSVTTRKAIEESLRVLSSMQTEGVSQADLEETKRSIKNSFVFNFETPDNIINRVVTLSLLGYPANYDETYVPGILGLTEQDVQSVAQKRWDTDSFVVVVVGDESAYNQLAVAVADQSSALYGLPLKRVKFDQKLLN